ncbi:MAG: DUF177 domain-containing protein [Alistipes sp.]
MEVTETYSIAYKGLKNGLHDFQFEVDSALFAAYDNTEIKNCDCAVAVALGRAETMLTLDVTITGEVTVACDRCLEDCSLPIDFEGELLVKFSDEIDEYDGEVMWLSPVENEVNLAQYIYESILLSLPYQRVHPEGQCDPVMLERFRIISEEELTAIAARAEEHNEGEWAKLAALKEQMNDQTEVTNAEQEAKIILPEK